MKVTLNLDQTRQLIGTTVTPGPLRDKIHRFLGAESVEMVRTAAGWELDIKLSPERIEELKEKYKAGPSQDLVLQALGLEQEDILNIHLDISTDQAVELIGEHATFDLQQDLIERVERALKGKASWVMATRGEPGREQIYIEISPSNLQALGEEFPAATNTGIVKRALGLMQEETPDQGLEQDLTKWWLEQATDEARATVPKAIEYGSDDLMEMGRTLARITGREMTPQECAEFGIYWYVLGKMARWTAAVKDGRPVSDDTILDIGVYTKMVQRIRQEGGWPYKYKENQ